MNSASASPSAPGTRPARRARGETRTLTERLVGQRTPVDRSSGVYRPSHPCALSSRVCGSIGVASYGGGRGGRALAKPLLCTSSELPIRAAVACVGRTLRMAEKRRRRLVSRAHPTTGTCRTHPPIAPASRPVSAAANVCQERLMPDSQPGIVSYGTYLPKYRLARAISVRR